MFAEETFTEDTELVQRAQRGDSAAFSELVDRFQGVVLATVLRRVRNRADADDVAQEVFLRAFRKLPQLREAERFAGWIRQIAARLSINFLVRGPSEVLCGSEFEADQSARVADPLGSMLDRERASELREGIQRLGSMDRDTLEAFYFRGRSLKEMSEEFDSPIGTIKRRLHTARHRLRDELGAAQPA